MSNTVLQPHVVSLLPAAPCVRRFLLTNRRQERRQEKANADNLLARTAAPCFSSHYCAGAGLRVVGSDIADIAHLSAGILPDRPAQCKRKRRRLPPVAPIAPLQRAHPAPDAFGTTIPRVSAQRVFHGESPISRPPATPARAACVGRLWPVVWASFAMPSSVQDMGVDRPPSVRLSMVSVDPCWPTSTRRARR